MTEAGEEFPPTCVEDIECYDSGDVLDGFCEWRADDPEPGPNRSPGFRWGWANAKRDHGPADEFEALRFACIRAWRSAA